jgi:hypothetical protein
MNILPWNIIEERIKLYEHNVKVLNSSKIYILIFIIIILLYY